MRMDDTNRDCYCKDHENISESLQKILAELSKINTAIIGSIDGQQTGMMSELKDLKRRVSDIEVFVNEIKTKVSQLVWKLIVAGIVGGLLSVGGKEVVSLIVK
jgi:hypothetical protein